MFMRFESGSFGVLPPTEVAPRKLPSDPHQSVFAVQVKEAKRFQWDVLGGHLGMTSCRTKTKGTKGSLKNKKIITKLS